MKLLIRMFIIAFFILAAAGCNTLRNTSEWTPQQLALMEATAQYRLPKKSIPAKQHFDAEIAASLRQMEKIAIDLNLIYDGSRSESGIFTLGAYGKHDQIVLSFIFYRAENGRVAFQDTFISRVPDSEIRDDMRRQVRRALLGS